MRHRRHADEPGADRAECTDPDGFRRVNATRRGTGLRISFSRKVRNPVRIQIHRVSTTKTRRIKTTLIKRWRNKTRSFTWNGKPRRGVTVEPGIYTVRFQIRDAGGRLDSAPCGDRAQARPLRQAPAVLPRGHLQAVAE